MGLSENLSALKGRAERQLDVLNSTEKTKNALLLPFLEALGYDPFDVREIEPEYPVDSGGEDSITVDYAVRIDGAPAMLLHCTEAAASAEAAANLDVGGGDLFFRPAEELPASLAVLTNGIVYQFFADLEGGAGVDDRPFLEFNLLGQEPGQITYLKRLTKPAFDAQKVLSAAFELKYTRLLEHYLAEQREDPDKHFVRFLAAQIFEGEVTEDALGQFDSVVRRFLRQFEMEEPEIPARVPSQPGDSSQQEASSRQEVASESEAASQPDDSSTPEAPSQPDPSPQTEDTNRADETTQGGDPDSTTEEAVELDAHLQQAPAGLSDNDEQQNVAPSSEAPSSDPSPEKGEHPGSEEDLHSGEAENGALKDEEVEEKELNEELEDEAPDGGGSIAQEFANKVIGDS